MTRKKSAARGSASSSTQGLKPAVAFRLQNEAEMKLRAKMDLLKSAIDQLKLSGNDLLARDLPGSRRAFLIWQPTSPDGIPLSKSSNDTLKKHPEILASVEDAVSAVKNLQSAKKNAISTKADRLASSRRSQKLHLAIRQIAERALVVARKEVMNHRHEIELLKSKLASAENEFRQNVEKLSAECIELRSENARLAKTLAKSIPLKSLQ